MNSELHKDESTLTTTQAHEFRFGRGRCDHPTPSLEVAERTHDERTRETCIAVQNITVGVSGPIALAALAACPVCGSKARCRCYRRPVCHLCGPRKPCTCKPRPVVTPVVNGPISADWYEKKKAEADGPSLHTQEYPSSPPPQAQYNGLRIDSTLAQEVAFPRFMPLDVAVRALFLLAYPATVGVWVRDEHHSLDVLSDLHQLLSTGIFGAFKISGDAGEVALLDHWDAMGRLVTITDRKVTQGHFRGVTFARVWDVRDYVHQR